jgi:hypothetical protein
MTINAQVLNRDRPCLTACIDDRAVPCGALRRRQEALRFSAHRQDACPRIVAAWSPPVCSNADRFIGTRIPS